MKAESKLTVLRCLRSRGNQTIRPKIAVVDGLSDARAQRINRNASAIDRRDQFQLLFEGYQILYQLLMDFRSVIKHFETIISEYPMLRTSANVRIRSNCRS
jgi:hypothetical protein